MPLGTQATGPGRIDRPGGTVPMKEKPHAVFMARVIVAGIVCECGRPLTITDAGYVCVSPGCAWYDKPMVAVTMTAAAMYERKKASA